MIPAECKRLAEIDFPIAVVSKHSAREKLIRHGHPSTLHLWWARRPLAACRSMLIALLLPDPCEEACPDQFKRTARKLLSERSFVGIKPGQDDLDLREALLRFVGDFANWDNSIKGDYVAVARGLVQAAYPDGPPLVVDPFSGGGSIPLEAMRIGTDVFASDLNPVACQILKVTLEDVPRQGLSFADRFEQVCGNVSDAASGELAALYPPDPDGAQPIAYMWARTVRCESPKCGAEIPLIRSFWLCKKSTRMQAMRPVVVRRSEEAPEVCFEIFEPSGTAEVPEPTVNRAKATCLCCGAVLPEERVRAQLRQQRGGADTVFDEHGIRIGGAVMLAVATLHPTASGRQYRLPEKRDYDAVREAQQRLSVVEKNPTGTDEHRLSPIPDESIPEERRTGNSGFRVLLYGITKWRQLHTSRQLLSLHTLCRICCEIDTASSGMATAVSLAVSKTANLNNANAYWEPIAECPRLMITRHDIAMAWDYVEAVPISGSSGSFETVVSGISNAIGSTQVGANRAAVTQLADARHHPLPEDSADIWFTDPPYYDAIAYADLSDFFLVWQKRAVREHEVLQDPFDPGNPLSPKVQEAIQDESRELASGRKDKAFFEMAMGEAFSEGKRVLRDEGIGCVVFAHKTTEGWEALLAGIITAGWTIAASWPIATEAQNRLSARQNASLSTSIHLVCRPRPENAPVGDWADVLRELPQRVGDWMERLQQEGVRGADLVFACIGPALEVYSRYSQVETAEGHVVPLGGDPEAFEPQKRGFLAYVWEVIGRSALGQVLGTAEAKARNGAVGALEEDARLTALFLWTLQATANGNGDEDEDEAPARGRSKGFSLAYDVARRFAQPLGIHLEEWEDRIIETKDGTVRLLPISERAAQLFGQDGAQAVADRIETDVSAKNNPQMALFPDEAPTVRGRRRSRSNADVSDGDLETTSAATTLDRIHAAMLLQAGGRTNALRALLRAEVDRGPDFVRLANALSALYPRGSEEKRIVDAMLLAVPR